MIDEPGAAPGEPVAVQTNPGTGVTDAQGTGAGPPTAGGPPPSRGRPGWLVPAIIAALAAVASGVIVYLVTDSGSSSSTATVATGTGPTPPPATTATTAPPPPTGEINLQAIVPGTLFSECQLQDPLPGATETALCLPTELTPNHPDQWEVSIFPDQVSMEKAYAAAFAAARKAAPALKANTGRCPSGVGEHAWKHPGGEVDAGRVFCYVAGGEFFLGWTHLKNKGTVPQPDHVDLFALARIDEASHFELADWWRFWHHRIGKQT